ncbi:hypothetical protein COX24_00655 [bacterium (Candidatus Gribaldobacteria) CG23_combo_of_CG06-09_8_20_14_all_37_87_8]|uniref:CYTH domain-containing protein n=1 Tax=bacterium (Candidatus Gribaldobacteria) CG23_combo_of_CG06-09_8_20_14_all_37_87_8 TaxID=2014278 RepID=A0A2G9ZHB4_9BACT|nr:MAG: hypothetical protein COX24_00655 [bacterium (Candidatus Gribaldobacteria) CG23_combo_of_CG06-09_8_20_14_all_37_87_8]
MEKEFNLALKYSCKDFARVRRTLCEIGAEKIIVKRQKDYFFNLPKNKDLKIPLCLKLRVEGKKETTSASR